jgi:hypothetical protein
MIFGDTSIYAIEVHHQPVDDNAFYITGKICIYFFKKAFGDINNEYCDLDQPYETLLDKIKNINELEYEFDLHNDYEIFNFLDDKLYIEDYKRTLDQIKKDGELYFKFNFLTNAGETFDGTKSFIYVDKNNMVHILYQIHDKKNEITCIKLDREIFKETTIDYIKWYEETYKNRK